ncbi:MAG: hypothetical protein H6569_09720 [Lewinellaceae bacterium]|nr:hypothetical protein [Lewinellaceae bacterium]
MLSENEIKRAFLPFLKEFYKFRYEYRPESVQTELDKIGTGGIIADGMVSFRKEDGTVFTCTYEATSADKAAEVKFTLNVQYFTWDCMAFGAVTAAAAYAIAYIFYLPWLAGLQWTGNLGFVLGMGMVGFLGWYLTMQRWRKYRYIYAIEQFKQYFAHEQWIALAADVFPAVTDPYFLELKSQCVYNGFGLALVSEREPVRVINAPSRLGIFGKDRKMVQWVTRTQVFQTMAHNVSSLSQYKPALPDEFTQQWNKVSRPVRYLLLDPIWKAFSKPLGQSNRTFDRYMRGHSVQKWVFTVALLAIAPLAFQVLTIREDFVGDVVELPSSNPEDQYGYLYEGDAPVRDPRAIPKQDPEPVSSEPEIQTINLSGDEEDIPTIDLSGGTEEPETDCPSHLSQRGWIVLDNTFLNKVFADERAKVLEQKGIECEVFAKKCIGEGVGYMLRVGPISLNESTANQKAQNYTKAMDRYGLLQQPLLVRRIN